MWSELESLVEQQAFEGKQSNAARTRSLLALYGALTNCQIAFDRVENSTSDGKDADADAVVALDVMLATLHNVQPVLELFESRLAGELRSYVRSTDRSDDADVPKDRLRERVDKLRELLSLAATENDLEVSTPSAFRGVRRQLGGFIREKCSFDELFAV